mgnify:CR=1 FL=1
MVACCSSIVLAARGVDHIKWFLTLPFINRCSTIRTKCYISKKQGLPLYVNVLEMSYRQFNCLHFRRDKNIWAVLWRSPCRSFAGHRHSRDWESYQMSQQLWRETDLPLHGSSQSWNGKTMLFEWKLLGFFHCRLLSVPKAHFLWHDWVMVLLLLVLMHWSSPSWSPVLHLRGIIRPIVIYVTCSEKGLPWFSARRLFLWW